MICSRAFCPISYEIVALLRTFTLGKEKGDVDAETEAREEKEKEKERDTEKEKEKEKEQNESGQGSGAARFAVREKYAMHFVTGSIGVERDTILRVLNRAVVGEGERERGREGEREREKRGWGRV